MSEPDNPWWSCKRSTNKLKCAICTPSDAKDVGDGCGGVRGRETDRERERDRERVGRKDRLQKQEDSESRREGSEHEGRNSTR